MTFSLTPKQIEVRDNLIARYDDCLVYGGARSTKTFLLCWTIAVRALGAPGSRHLIARLHHIDVRTSVMMDTWPKMMRLAFPGVAYATNKTDQYASLPDGSEVWFGGLDDDERVDKVLGREYATILFNECSQISYAARTTVLTRLAQNVECVDGRPLRLKALYDLNPVGQGHWTHKEFVQGLDPVTGQKLVGGSRGYAVLNPADNPRLPPDALARLAALPTRQRQRFYEGKYLSEVPGALWPLDTIERLRVTEAPQLTRIVVAVDPSGSDGTGGDSQGIVVAGLGTDGDAYVIADRSCRRSPDGWARQAVNAYHEFGADLIVAEVNFGGAMVENTIRTVDPSVAFKAVTASRGKHVRAEPVAALYENVLDPEDRVIRAGRVHHVGTFPELEEQMGMFTTAGYQGAGSPDRCDALVWCLTELMLPEIGKLDGFLAYARSYVAEVEGKEALGSVRLKAPAGTTAFEMNGGARYEPDQDRCFAALPEHVIELKALGCEEIAVAA